MHVKISRIGIDLKMPKFLHGKTITRPGPLTPTIFPKRKTTTLSNSPIFLTKNQYVMGSVITKKK